MPFASLEEIEKHYGEAIKRASPEAAAELRIEKAEVVADHKLRLVADREHKVWLRDALHDWPLAAEFPELVRGDNEEDVRKAARELHHRLVDLSDKHQRQQTINKLVEQQLNAPNGEVTSPEGGEGQNAE